MTIPFINKDRSLFYYGTKVELKLVYETESSHPSWEKFGVSNCFLSSSKRGGLKTYNNDLRLTDV